MCHIAKTERDGYNIKSVVREGQLLAVAERHAAIDSLLAETLRAEPEHLVIDIGRPHFPFGSCILSELQRQISGAGSDIKNFPSLLNTRLGNRVMLPEPMHAK